MAQTLAKFLNIPIAICDATSLTEAGYVGEDVENILTRLLQEAGGDIQKAQKESYLLMRLIRFQDFQRIVQLRVMFQGKACSKRF